MSKKCYQIVATQVTLWKIWVIVIEIALNLVAKSEQLYVIQLEQIMFTEVVFPTSVWHGIGLLAVSVEGSNYERIEWPKGTKFFLNCFLLQSLQVKPIEWYSEVRKKRLQ